MSESESHDGLHRRSAGPAAIRGAILVVVAALIGLVLLDSGLDNEVSATNTPGDDDDTAAVTTTTTTLALRPPSAVVVLVANGTTTPGAATAYKDAIEGIGYGVAEPTNANATVDSSIVYFAPRFRAEAERLAITLGLPSAAVQPLPISPPVEDLADASILVVLGPELAETEPALTTGDGADPGAGEGTDGGTGDGAGDGADDEVESGDAGSEAPEEG